MGMGTHKELMETCETYQEIAVSQLSEKELRETSGKSLLPGQGQSEAEQERGGVIE